MAARKKSKPAPKKLVRRVFLIDPEKLEMTRKAIGASSDAEVVRIAIDHLLSHFPTGRDEEE